MFNPRKKTSRNGGKEKQKGKGKPPMFTHRRGIFSKRDVSDDVTKPWAAVGTWFLGPKAENADVFIDLMFDSIRAHMDFRRGFYPCDPPYVTDELRKAESFKRSYEKIKTELDNIQKDLYRSVPFFSTRYKGHVNWDTAVPANLGYIASILWNQNNCAAEGGPATTGYEVQVGEDLCEMVGLNRDTSLGHLVAGGSVANVEAIWVARNLKYYALGLQEALLKEEQLRGARGYEINLPHHETPTLLITATQWELLNLDTDTIIKMPADVATLAEIDQKALRKILADYLYESIGAQEFCNRHKLTTSPCVVVASTYHVSFLKAVTITGLGKDCLVTVPVDANARMNSQVLEITLREKLLKKIPVISVISIMGTTEESAVDPLVDILSIRTKLSQEGLNFSIHADAAWGAYFSCMFREPHVSVAMASPAEESFVPELQLNSHVTDQLKALNQCDTITVDPHKSGFCPYPAGAICYRNQGLNNFLSLTSGVVYYHGDINLGDLGLEGSKPGAAATGVLLANRVIGLHKNGYGRILAECMFTSKILYCYWVCMAEDTDDFFCETTKPLPSGKIPVSPDSDEEVDYKTFIKRNVLGKSNEELSQDKYTMSILKEIGPDTMIPCFSVNIRENKDVSQCNNIVSAIFNDLSHASTEESEQRVPMIVTSSTMQDHKYSLALKKFKERLGLSTDNQEGVKYVITTCLDPWSTSLEFMDDFADIMRNAILNAIGTVTDKPDCHSFVCTDKVNEKNEIFVCYAGNFSQTQHRYFSVARFKFHSEADVATFNDAVQKAGDQPVVMQNLKTEPKKLHDLLFNDSEEKRETVKFDFFVGLPSGIIRPFMTADMEIKDVPRYDHFDKADEQYPEVATYVMYGNLNDAYLFHIPTKDPDYLQIVRLAEVPKGLGDGGEKSVVLKQGVDAELPRVPGSPTFDPQTKKIKDPLADTKYDVEFVGIQGQEIKTTVMIQKKIWFDGDVLNKSAVA